MSSLKSSTHLGWRNLPFDLLTLHTFFCPHIWFMDDWLLLVSAASMTSSCIRLAVCIISAIAAILSWEGKTSLEMTTRKCKIWKEDIWQWIIKQILQRTSLIQLIRYICNNTKQNYDSFRTQTLKIILPVKILNFESLILD